MRAHPLHGTDELDELYLRDAVRAGRPRHLGTWDQPPGAPLVERRLIDWTAERIGLGPAAAGAFTDGGTDAELQALLLAREEAGDRDPATLRIFVSEAAQAGVRHTARLLGLGEETVVTVPTDRDKRLQTVALARALERCARDDLSPMAVVASAGTADFGSIDPLPEIARLCAQYGTWLHVDASYGCGLLASRRNRHLIDGIERADSVAVDFGKAFCEPVGSSAVLVRGRELPEPRAGRRFDALKPWMALRVRGAHGIGDRFDEACALATRGWELLVADPRFDVVAEPRLATLVFRHIPATICSPAAIDRANLYARKALHASGDAVVATTRAGGRQYLRFTLLDPDTTTADIEAVLDLIAGHAEQYLGEHLERAC
ncbi:pyridoxal-dependent decarboxylase [Streptomyces sp. SID335]|uniref:Pyridoxal-dependent decarboxylase n=1 Tax=Streptomyces venezuelae TaxID=54571 RepID=A0A5P2BBD6_STRVZ|nr:pyridoxal-dependent decarboxylase [Streptomyces sp. SID335]MYZ15641.1 pyridoxal-dependent decarboxylase [Streptomyces sp. SID337]NDZ88639.1 pyridoxal-dependent decarboxylase [Streptomyces sp. SID10115]NEB44315.1 pyridoxal-dependent decarboxylase [Streptomyces sp. SID339]QES27367.1 pyridoxal-dependent decarboxylase [Streptomyces venezuelae]